MYAFAAREPLTSRAFVRRRELVLRLRGAARRAFVRRLRLRPVDPARPIALRAVVCIAGVC
jgi:hypothetical protein